MAELSEIGKLANQLRSALALAERSPGKPRLQGAKDGLAAVELIKRASKGVKDHQGRANLEAAERRLRELLRQGARETIIQLIELARSPNCNPEIRPKSVDAIKTLLKEHGLAAADFGITEGNLIAWQTANLA